MRNHNLSPPHDDRLWLINLSEMELKKSTTESLKKIIYQDYGVELSDEQANELGYSLLRLTRITGVAFARAEEKNSSVQARGRKLLGANTNT